jgi:large subunit ribosomal protein L30
MRRTLAAIGLRHHQASIVQQDSASLRGQLKHVRHLIEVSPVPE